MKIQFLKGTNTSKGKANAGDVLDLPLDEVNSLMRLLRAVPYCEPIQEDNRSIGLSVSDSPKLSSRRKRG